MTFLQALKKARKRIESKQSKFICHALEDVGAKEYRHLVEDQLGHCHSYEGWLCEEHNKIYRKMRQAKGDAFLEGRLQWIDYMIKEETAKEKPMR